MPSPATHVPYESLSIVMLGKKLLVMEDKDRTDSTHVISWC